MNEYEIMGACGIICDGCDILLAAEDEKIAKTTARWFKENLNIDIAPEKFRCDGCHGDRNNHWSPECFILKCCIDEKGLENCSQCDEFPCEALKEWAAQNARYTEALNRLKSINESV